MTARQFLVLKAARGVAHCLNKNQDLYAHAPGFVRQKDRLDERIRRARQLAQRQEEGSRGVTRQHESLRTELIDRTATVAAVAQGWAAAEGKPAMAEQFAVTPSELRSLGLRADMRARAIAERARQALEQGARDYGLTPEMVDDLDSVLDTLEEALTPRSARTERKTVTRALRQELEAIAQLLREVLDPLVKSLLLREPLFCQEYADARRIGGRASRRPSPEALAVTRVEMAQEGFLLEEDDAETDEALNVALGPEEEADEPATAEATPTPTTGRPAVPEGEGAGLAS